MVPLTGPAIRLCALPHSGMVSTACVCFYVSLSARHGISAAQLVLADLDWTFVSCLFGGLFSNVLMAFAAHIFVLVMVSFAGCMTPCHVIFLETIH